MAFRKLYLKANRAVNTPSASDFSKTIILTLLLLAAYLLLGIRMAQAQSSSPSYVYDSLGRLIAAYDASGNAAVYNYDAAGNLKSITNAPANQLSGIELSSDQGTSGSNVTIYGTDFCSSPTVTFNGTQGTVDSSSSTEIVATVPSGASTGQVAVSCPNGSVNVGTFTVGTNAPSISGFTPAIGAAGTAVTVNGGNFETTPASDTARFNLSPAPVNSATSTSLNTSVPITAVTGHISIATPYGEATSSAYFFVPPAGVAESSIAETGQISVGGPAVTATISTAGDKAIYAFDGTAGEQISLQATNITLYYPNISILNPDGSTLATTSSGFIDVQTLPRTGTYVIFVDSNNSTGSVTLQLNNATQVNGTITVGGPAVTETLNAGQDAYLTFSGTAGQQISLNASNISLYYPSISILNPDGSTLVTSSGSIAVQELPNTGSYSIFIDSGAQAGSMTVQLYNESDVSASVNVSDAYATAVLADQPLNYWRLDEGGPATAANAMPAIQYAVSGPTAPDAAVRLANGTSYISTTTQLTSPSSYSVEIWFKTTTQSGGKLIGFGSSQTGVSSSYDRHIYMTNSGQLIFGQNNGSNITVTSPGSYNDGNWHQAVGTYDGSTMVLYVDGVEVASTSTTAPNNYSGYWHIGYGNLNTWPSAPTSYYFTGSLGEAAVWNGTALSSGQVSNEFSAASGGNYDSVVLADSPSSYWKLNESSGPTLADSTGGGNTATAQAISDNGLYVGGVTYGQPGAISGDNAVTLDGSSGYVTSLLSYTNPGPFSVEVWFKTTTTAGGMLIGFGDHQTGSSGNYDRHIYMTNSGQLVFGTCCSVTTIETSGSYNDGNWHYAVGTWANNTLSFYVDGSLIGTATGNLQSYTGYWRLGYDNLGGWPSSPSSYYFAGTIDDAAVYDYALSATQIANHYSASGR